MGAPRGALAFALLSLLAAGPARGEDSAATVLAPGWQRLDYAAPEPGTYELPPLGRAADGVLLDTHGEPVRLYDVFGDDVVVLSFIYTSCPDINGCPLASHVMHRVQGRLRDDSTLAERVRLVSISFDPRHDTPETMRRHANGLSLPDVDWRFLTAESDDALAPVLDAYDQTIQREYDVEGKPLGTISHILRVFLIDRERRIRNVYSASLLHSDTLWSDVLTVLSDTNPSPNQEPKRLSQPRALDGAVPLGLPPPAWSEPLTREKVDLGRKLFFDRRISRNETISCAMCHVPEQGFTSNEMATSVGIEGRTVRRNAPTLYNVAYAERLFHDAREDRLEQQVWSPLLDAREMGNPSVGYVLERLRKLPDYDGLFEAAFGGRGPSMETVGDALAAYQRTLLSGSSAFDRWRYGGDDTALSPAAQRGYELFVGKAGCSACHVVGPESALFTDHALHDTGIGYRQTMTPPPSEIQVRIAPGVYVPVDPQVIAAASEPRPGDLGRYEITERPEDRWKYRTPTLRNVALTAPYMHDGSLPTLDAVVEFYVAGGVPHELLDERIRPLDLNEQERADLVMFLRSLTGNNVDRIVAEAVATPVGDPGSRK